jgi:hypothetical protein
MTLGSGLAFSGSFSVIASMSLAAASTPSICFSVSAICFKGGCCGAAWAGRHLLRRLGLRQCAAGGDGNHRGREAGNAQRRGDGTNELTHGSLLGLGDVFEFQG